MLLGFWPATMDGRTEALRTDSSYTGRNRVEVRSLAEEGTGGASCDVALGVISVWCQRAISSSRA